MDDNYQEYDLMPLEAATNNYSFVGFLEHSNTPTSTPAPALTTTNQPITKLRHVVTSATSLVTNLTPLFSSDPEHATVLQMTKTALIRLHEHYLFNYTNLEVPPSSGSRLRVGKELKPEKRLQNLRWKKSADLLIAPSGLTATWNSTINTVHWASTKCHSRLHSGHYQVVLELQQVQEASHIRVGFLLEYIASNGRRHVDWGNMGGTIGTSSTSWGIDVMSASQVTMELHLPPDQRGCAYFITPQHGRSAPIALPPGAVAIPACSMERKGQTVTIVSVRELEDAQYSGDAWLDDDPGGPGDSGDPGDPGDPVQENSTTNTTTSTTAMRRRRRTTTAMEKDSDNGNGMLAVIQMQVTKISNALVRLQAYTTTWVANVRDQPRKRRALDHLITSLCSTVDPLKMSLHALYLSDKFGTEPDRQEQEQERRRERNGGARNGENKESSRGMLDAVQLEQEEKSGEEEHVQHYNEATLRVASNQSNQGEEEDVNDYANLFVGDNESVGNLNMVIKIVSDEDGRSFWLASFGQTTYQVTWNYFVHQLHGWLCRDAATDSNDTTTTTTTTTTTNLSVLLTEDTLHNLKLTLDRAESGMINIYCFSALLEGFGPTLRTAVQKMASTLKETWFHGFISFEETKEILRGCEIGTFLVRFSSSRRCCFSIACVVEDKTKQTEETGDSGAATAVQQILIEATKNQGYRTSNGHYYNSMADVVHAHGGVLKFPAPNTLSRCRFFHGFLTFNETVALLKKRKIGSYLMRFSKSQPGSLVIAYTSRSSSSNSRSNSSTGSTERGGGGTVKQSLVYSSPEGYRIGDKIWSTLDALIYDNKSKLIEPCFAVEYEAFKDSTEAQQQQQQMKTKTKKVGLQQSRQRPPPLLQRALSAPIYNRMFPISPTDARVNEGTQQSKIKTNNTAAARLGGSLFGGIVCEADMNNFIGMYDLVSQPPLVVPTSSFECGGGSSGSGGGGGGGTLGVGSDGCGHITAAQLAAGHSTAAPSRARVISKDSKKSSQSQLPEGPD